MVFLRTPKAEDIQEITSAYENSISIHNPWAFAPQNYVNYIQQEGRYFVCSSETGAIVGTLNISGVVRGYFQSGYLGYEVFHPYQGRGFMRQGLKLLLEEAFGPLNLHRLEANIQPDNVASIKLVANAGFVQEGFSRNYVRVGGFEWKDHVLWAIISSNWVEEKIYS